MAVNAHLKSEEELEGEGAVEEGSEGDVDLEKDADEDEDESKEGVMDEDGNCLGRRRRGWSGGNMSSLGASYVAHAKRLTALPVSFACLRLKITQRK